MNSPAAFGARQRLEAQDRALSQPEWEALLAACTKGQALAWVNVHNPQPPARRRSLGRKTKQRDARSADAASAQALAGQVAATEVVARQVLVWVGWLQHSALVVVGEGEQQVPGLVEAAGRQGRVQVSVRSSDTKARIASWPTTARVLQPGSQQWEQAAAILAPLRLNGPVAAKALPAMWRERATLIALDPAVNDADGEPRTTEQHHLLAQVEHPALGTSPDTLPTSALRDQPVPTPATTD